MATAGSATTCYDNGGVSRGTQQYSMEQNNGSDQMRPVLPDAGRGAVAFKTLYSRLPLGVALVGTERKAESYMKWFKRRLMCLLRVCPETIH